MKSIPLSSLAMAAAVAGSTLLSLPAEAAGTAMPWEAPLEAILDSIEGPVARIMAVIIITITGLGWEGKVPLFQEVVPDRNDVYTCADLRNVKLVRREDGPTETVTKFSYGLFNDFEGVPPIVFHQVWYVLKEEYLRFVFFSQGTNVVKQSSPYFVLEPLLRS